MTSSTPNTAGIQHYAEPPRRRRARWVAPVLILLAIYCTYTVYLHRPQVPPGQTAAAPMPTPTPERADSSADPSADAIVQLTCAVETAQSRVDQSTAQLANLQARVDAAGDLHRVQQTALQVNQELEQATGSRQVNQQLLQKLQIAQNDPARLTASDAQVLGTQHTVCRLREALTAAESSRAQLLLTMLPDHPRVQACRAKEQAIRQQLPDALDATIRDVQAEQARWDTIYDTLSRDSARVQEQVQQLAAIHADYAHQAALVAQQTSELTRAQRDLSQAQSSHAAPHELSVTDSADRPAAVAAPPVRGLGRTLLWAAAIVGGLFVSLGLYSLRSASVTGARVTPATSPPDAPTPAQPPARSVPQIPLPPAAQATTAPRTSASMTLRQALERCAEKQVRE